LINSGKPGIFLSHTHSDNHFAKRLALDLNRAGAKVWIDEAEIFVWDSIIEKIRQSIDRMDYVAAIIVRVS
jgi:hypothetical protein